MPRPRWPDSTNSVSEVPGTLQTALIVQAFVDQLYSARGLGHPPEVKAVVVPKPSGTGYDITWNVSFPELSELAGKDLNFDIGTPLTAGAHCNRLLLSAAQQGCDLFVGRPMGALVGDKLYEAVHTAARLPETIRQLKEEVEFPDVRRLVNGDHLGFKEVLAIRAKAFRFRQWLQVGADRDRNALIAYHHEVAREAGFSRVGRTALNLFGVVGGGAASAAIGSLVAGPVGAAIGGAVGSGATLLFEIASKIGANWRPVVFGDWMRSRIEALVKERQGQ